VRSADGRRGEILSVMRKASGTEVVPTATGSPMFTGPHSSFPPPQSGGALKIVLIIVGILGLILILMIGSCF